MKGLAVVTVRPQGDVGTANPMATDEDLASEPHRPPSEITPDRDFFDRFAARIANLVSRGPFFFICVLGMIVWIGVGIIAGFSNRWLGWGATCMAVAVLLLLAILENAQRRSDQAVQRKLNAIADALAGFIEHSTPR